MSHSEITSKFSPITRLLALIYKEFVVIWMDKGSRKILILPIILQSILFGYGATFNLDSVPYILYQDSFDQDATAIVQRINNNGTFDLTRYCSSEQCFKQSLDEGVGLIGIYIAGDFPQTRTIYLATDARNTASANTASGYVQGIISAYNQEQQEHYRSASSGGTHTSASALSINFRYLYNNNNITRYGLLTGMILALSMIQVMMLASLSVSREREDGTFDMMLMSPLTPVEILIGKAIPPTVIATTQGIGLFLICLLWFEIPFNGNFFALLTVIVIFSLCTVGVGLAISALTNTAQQSIVLSFTFLLPCIILSGLITPRSAMPELMQYVTLLDPFYYGMEALHRIYLEGQTFMQVSHLMLPLLVLGAITMSGAVWLFKGKLG